MLRSAITSLSLSRSVSLAFASSSSACSTSSPVFSAVSRRRSIRVSETLLRYFSIDSMARRSSASATSRDFLWKRTWTSLPASLAAMSRSNWAFLAASWASRSSIWASSVPSLTNCPSRHALADSSPASRAGTSTCSMSVSSTESSLTGSAAGELRSDREERDRQQGGDEDSHDRSSIQSCPQAPREALPRPSRSRVASLTKVPCQDRSPGQASAQQIECASAAGNWQDHRARNRHLHPTCEKPTPSHLSNSNSSCLFADARNVATPCRVIRVIRGCSKPDPRVHRVDQVVEPGVAQRPLAAGDAADDRRTGRRPAIWLPVRSSNDTVTSTLRP